MCNVAFFGIPPPTRTDLDLVNEGRTLETYRLVINVALESAFKFPTSKTFSTRHFSPDCTRPDDDDDSQGLEVAAGEAGPDARMGDWRTT